MRSLIIVRLELVANFWIFSFSIVEFGGIGDHKIKRANGDNLNVHKASNMPPPPPASPAVVKQWIPALS